MSKVWLVDGVLGKSISKPTAFNSTCLIPRLKLVSRISYRTKHNLSCISCKESRMTTDWPSCVSDVLVICIFHVQKRVLRAKALQFRDQLSIRSLAPERAVLGHPCLRTPLRGLKTITRSNDLFTRPSEVGWADTGSQSNLVIADLLAQGISKSCTKVLIPLFQI